MAEKCRNIQVQFNSFLEYSAASLVQQMGQQKSGCYRECATMERSNL